MGSNGKVSMTNGFEMTKLANEHDNKITKNSNGTALYSLKNGNAYHSHEETQIDISLDQFDTSRIYKEPSNSEAKSQHTVTFTHHRCSRKRCCLFFLIFILILTIAVLAIYFTVSNKEDSDKSSQVEGHFTILDLKYNESYRDRNSQKSKSLADYLESKLNQLYRNSLLAKFFNQTIVIQFRAGSIIPHFQLIFLKDFDSEYLEDTTRDIFVQGTEVRDGKTYFGKYQIEVSSIDFEAIPKRKNINTPSSQLSSSSLAPTTTPELSTYFIASSTTLGTITNSIQDITTESSQTLSANSLDTTITYPEESPTEVLDYITTETYGLTTLEPQEETTSVDYEVNTAPINDSTFVEETTTVSTTTIRPCSQIVLDYCSDRSQVPYSNTIFPNYFGHESIVDLLTMAQLEKVAKSNCHPYVQRFMCSLAAPKCVQGFRQPIPPCRQLCTEVFQKCIRKVPQLLKESNIDCTLFPEEGTAECVGAPELPTVPVRLVAGAGSFEGRVEVYHEGQWGTVCSEGWDDNDASIICKQLNLTDTGRARLNAYFAEGNASQPSVLTKVNCTGKEDHLALCGEIQWSASGQACDHSKDAGVTCDVTNKVISNIQFRLTGGDRPSEGIVELYYNGEWGTICDDSFDIDDEMREYSVICRMFNYTEYARKASNEQYTTSAKTIWLDNVFCGENENNIVLCNHGGWGKHNCGHSEDVAVMCEPPIEETTTSLTVTGNYSTRNGTELTSSPMPFLGNVRLSWGLGPDSGAIEVLLEGSWGGICSDGVSQITANLFCHFLGYINVTATFMNETSLTNDIQNNVSKVKFASVSCLGNESEIFECTYKLLSSDIPCSQRQSAMISCLPDFQDMSDGFGTLIPDRAETATETYQITTNNDSNLVTSTESQGRR